MGGNPRIQGAGQPFLDGQVEAVFRRLEDVLYRGLAGRVKDTLLLVSADHGQVPVGERHHPPGADADALPRRRQLYVPVQTPYRGLLQRRVC